MSDSFIEQNVDRANFERSADLEMDESNNTFKHAQLEGTRPCGKKWYCWSCRWCQSSSTQMDVDVSRLQLRWMWQMVSTRWQRAPLLFFFFSCEVLGTYKFSERTIVTQFVVKTRRRRRRRRNRRRKRSTVMSSKKWDNFRAGVKFGVDRKRGGGTKKSCKIYFGSPPSQKKNRESDQPLLLKVDWNHFFYMFLNLLSSRSRPHQSLSSPQSTLLLQSQSPPAASSVSSPPFHFFGGSICICQLSIGSR